MAEFVEGRQCAAGLLRQWDVVEEIGVADDRSPVWPNGFCGSITHSDQWVGCIVAPTTRVESIGIDTEPLATMEVRNVVMDTVATDIEWRLADQFFGSLETAFTVLFSAKEAVYKCWFPVVQIYFDFFDVELVAVNRAEITLRILPSNPAYGQGPEYLQVSYFLHDSNVFTLTCLENWS